MLNDSFHIILVEAEDNANIGAAARAVKNMGFSNLHLVSPPRFDFERAKITACNAEDLLEKTAVHSSLESALAGMEDVVGLSARCGKNRPTILLSEWLQELASTPRRRTALLFGPEETGLHDEHTKHCRWLVRIPTNPECSSLNLAQAVLIVLYELAKLRPGFKDAQRETRAVPWEEFKHLDALLSAALEKSGFYHKGTAPHSPSLSETYSGVSFLIIGR